MLTPLDDYFVHQTPQPLAYVATGDRRFYNRYFFAVFSHDGEIAAAAGIGIYPNTDVADGFAAVLRAGCQHNLRVSRKLWPDALASSAGPVRIEIVKPLLELRITVAPNAAGIAMDLAFESVADPWEEPHHFRRIGGRVAEDQHRYAQVGRCSGSVTVDGQTFALDPASNFALRDHSWGIRQGFGGPEIGEPAYAAAYGAVHWFQFRLGERAGYARLRESMTGDKLHVEGCITAAAGSSATVPITGVDHRLIFTPGTRRIAGGEITLQPEGEPPITLRIVAATTPLNEQGLGYQFGWADRLGHGVPRGPDHLEHDIWDARDPLRTVNLGPSTNPPQNRLFDNLLQLTDTRTVASGHGLYVFFAKGRYDPYGFGDDQ